MTNTRTENILDLSDLRGWARVSSKVVNSIFPIELIKVITEIDHDEMYSDTLSFLIDSCINFGFEIDGVFLDCDQWSELLDVEFKAEYTSIRAFHSCRTFKGLDSYKTRGIEKLSYDLLKELAIETFSQHCKLEDINRAVDEQNIANFKKGVYLFTDKARPLDPSKSHYLQSGSEILQALTSSLGIQSQAILASQGKPYMIECRIPIEDVALVLRHELWRILLTEHFQILAGGKNRDRPFDFCIRTNNNVSPGSILEFHEVNVSKIYSYAPTH